MTSAPVCNALVIGSWKGKGAGALRARIESMTSLLWQAARSVCPGLGSATAWIRLDQHFQYYIKGPDVSRDGRRLLRM